jgi:hypothetical protein
MRYLPGILGALAAFGVAKLVAWTELGLELELVGFLASYVAGTLAADRALLRYGRSTGRGG